MTLLWKKARQAPQCARTRSGCIGPGCWLKVPIAFLPCAFGVLTHESFALAAFPLVAACSLVARTAPRKLIWSLTIAVFALTVVVQMVGHPASALEGYMQWAAARFVLLALLSFSLGALHVVDSNSLGSGVHAMARGLGLIQW
jgi:hypothetical protein